MTLFTTVFLPVLISLGLWQLAREQEKRELQSLYDLRQSGLPLSLDQIDWAMADLSYQKVQVNGSFDNAHYFLLDNRIREGRVGYEVLMPFLTDSGSTLILNRGWIAQGESRAVLPLLMPVDGQVSVEGILYVPLSDQFVLSEIQESNSGTWPRVVQKIDIPAWSTALGRDLMPYSVRISQNSPGALEASWQTINMLPEKHRAYAVQWFTMALALLLMYLYFGIRNKPILKDDE